MERILFCFVFRCKMELPLTNLFFMYIIKYEKEIRDEGDNTL